MSTNPTPHALGPEEGEALWWATALLTVKATAEQTGGEFFLVEEFVPKGTAPPLHVHPEDDETFFVLEGELTFYLGDGQTVPASAGSFLHIPKGYFPHAFQVNSETARFLVLTTPRHEQFFRASAEPARSRTIPPPEPLDMEKVRAAGAEYGVEILGPPPGAQPQS
jgi:quercetin dioxygenase-like cupin family protein